MEKIMNSAYLDRYNKYNENYFKINLDGIGARNYDFVSSNTGFRKLIVSEWMDKVLGEPPSIVRKGWDEKKIYPMEFDFVDEAAQILHDTLAYGYIFIVPELKSGEWYFHSLTPNYAKDMEYIYDYETDKLIYLAYTVAGEVLENGEVIKTSFRHIHTYSVGTKIYKYEVQDLRKTNLPPSLKEVKFDVENMRPFLSATRDNQSVWEIADSLIVDVDSVYAEMLLDMQLSRKMLLLPDSFLEGGARKGTNSTPLISEHARVFRSYPAGLDQEKAMPIVFNGNFNPEPYINTMNIIANSISLKTGFGRGHFSYDRVEGFTTGFKTATEVTASRVDMNLAKTKINNILTSIIVKILSYKYPQYSEDSYIVQMSDGILDDPLTYKNKLFLDVTNGLIDHEFYLKESYGLEDVSELMPRIVDDNDTDNDDSNDNDMDDIGARSREENNASGSLQQKIFNSNLMTKPI